MIFNALEHGSKDDDVELSIVADGSDIVIAVRNQGPSIAADLLPTILDPLVRDTSADAQRRLGSVGLGLYIAREILAAHCGTIDVESSADLGSVFTVRPNHGDILLLVSSRGRPRRRSVPSNPRRCAVRTCH